MAPRLPARIATPFGRIELRAMRWWELPEVGRLEQRLFPADSWSEGMFWSELAEADSRYYVTAWRRPPAEVAGTPGDGPGAAEELVGYAGLLAALPHLVDTPGEASIQTIGVAPEVRRAGLGRRLMTTLLAVAAARGSRAVFLEVRVDNEPAQTLYRDLGFEPVGLRRRYYQPEGVDALVMRLDEPAAAFGRDESDDPRPPDERNDT